MAEKTQKEIDEQVEKLKAVRSKVKPCNAFGGSNLDQLDAQIKVLEDDMDSDKIYNEFDHSGMDEEILTAALDAQQWFGGGSDINDLAEGWPLID